ncbi:LPXTG cell wall anchor domain-containing protein [Cytobacillus depressus]|nr:LPXTG cell wall anchor domain-containing protein [Cytobacillus depressus]
MRKLKKVLIWILVVSFVFLYQSAGISAAEKKEFDIEVLPDSYAFNISKMVPGDWATRVLTIQNRGEHNFTYNTKAKFLNGSKKLYNEFLLKVWDANGILYEGKLHEFERLQPRRLQSKSQEDLKFEVKFPYELGNEYQGLGFEFELKFIVEGNTPTPGPDPDPNPDPNPKPDPDPKPNPDPDPKPDPVPNPNPDPTPNPNPENPQEEPLKPIRPIPNEELNSPPMKGQILPSTATNMYNNLLIGIIFIITGAVLFILQKRKKNNF